MPPPNTNAQEKHVFEIATSLITGFVIRFLHPTMETEGPSAFYFFKKTYDVLQLVSRYFFGLVEVVLSQAEKKDLWLGKDKLGRIKL